MIVSGAVGIQFGGRAALVTSVVFIAAYVAWAWGDTKSFDAWVAAPVRRRWLTWWRYTRRWESVCTLHGLTANLGERHLVPVLRSVQIGQHTDVLELRVVTSQSVADWQKRTEALAAAWRADRLVVRAITPGEAASDSHARRRPGATRRTPGRETGHHGGLGGRAGGGDRDPRMVACPAARAPCADRRCHRGRERQGGLWSLIAGIAPAVRTGKARLCVIDPKGGMELGHKPMFSFFSA